MTDFDVFILLVLLSTHLLAFGMGWALRHVNLRQIRQRSF
jgi:hypothetical protein